MKNTNNNFNLIMLSAEFEHFGNGLMRHLDGHPECLVYMAESQFGTKYSNNVLSFFHPCRYGYFDLPYGATAEDAWRLCWDEEVKTFCRKPERSKFSDCGAIINEERRKEYFISFFKDKEVNRKNAIIAYFNSFFESWENLNRSGAEKFTVGYIPGFVGETDKLMSDFPNAHMIHVVRNPWSAWADYNKRPFPQRTLSEYLMVYNIAHNLAYNYKTKYEDRFHIIRMEDLIADPRSTLSSPFEIIGLSQSDKCDYPSFNGVKLERLPPWGTVEYPTMEYNRKMADSLSREIQDIIRKECSFVIDTWY